MRFFTSAEGGKEYMGVSESSRKTWVTGKKRGRVEGSGTKHKGPKAATKLMQTRVWEQPVG